MLDFYCSSFDQKLNFVFRMYDFDEDSLISKTDITTIISCMPVAQKNRIRSEGKYTTEGGGAQNF